MNARFKDFDLEHKIWYLPDGKTGARQIVLSDNAACLVSNLPRHSGTDLLFPQPGTNKPYSCINNPFKRVLGKAELDKSIRVHDLRHSFASHALKNGAKLPELQRMLGHTQITTTMRYIHLQDDDVRDRCNAVASHLDV